MNDAEREQEAPEEECHSTEIPALLVAGGSCSRLCRSQRALPDDLPSVAPHLIGETRETPRATARE